jgi:type I restriction enzyme S subunit
MSEERTEPVRKPTGWCEAEVKEVLKIIDYRGRTPPYSPDGIPHLRSSNIRDGKIVWEGLKYVSQEIYDLYMTRGLPEKDDVLFTTEAPLGEVALAPNQKFSLAQRMMILKPPRNAILPKFLMYQIQSGGFQRKIGNVGTGTTVSGISSRNFKPIPLLIAPFAEQQRIVDKIEELFSDLDSGINSLKTAQQQLKVYRQAVLKWAFEGKLTAQWREEQQRQGKLASADTLLAQIKAEREQRYQKELEAWQSEVEAWEAIGKEGKKPRKPTKPKKLPPLIATEGLPSLPSTWQWIYHGELLENIEAGKSFRCEERPPNHEEYGVAKVSAVTWGKYNELESKTCLEQDKAEPRFLIQAGDCLFSRANTIQLVGACVVAKQANLKVMLSDKTLRFLYSKSVNQIYALHYLRCIYGRNEIEYLATGNQDSMRNIGQDRIRRIRFPLPSLQEQEQIVEEIESRLSICDQLEADIEANLKKAEALRQSILKQAFEGKLVPQNPNDEPAAILLERIRAEKKDQKIRGNTGERAKASSNQLSIEGVS